MWSEGQRERVMWRGANAEESPLVILKYYELRISFYIILHLSIS
jgi:hypothetical protein